jgi:RNA polymerase sigma factor (sigma-70 family)
MMANRLLETAIDRAGALAAPLALDQLPDAKLLSRFVAHRDEQAFAAIVRRHGPLVWSVCRSLLFSEADAEDAFQATFLVLVRNASRVQKPNALGAWLHSVAGRVCRNCLRSLTRRRKHERAAACPESDQPIDGATWDRWQATAYEEIERLPESLRVPFVLCVLQGMRQPEVAARLGWKLGTVSARVCKAKQRLTDAISRKGLSGAAAVAVALGAATSPLAACLCAKGAGVAQVGVGLSNSISPRIHELAHGAIGGLMTKTKLIATALVIGTLAIGVGTRVLSSADAQVPGQVAGAQPGSGGGGSVPKSGPTPLGGMPGASGGGGVNVPNYANKVEYRFVARPDLAAEFKNTLAKQGADGWEYVGTIPGQDELIFKRVTRQMMGGGSSGMGGLAPPGSGLPKGASSGSTTTPSAGGLGTPSSGAGGLPPMGLPGAGAPGLPGGGGASGFGSVAAKPSDTISIQAGETIRYRMATKLTIDRILNHDTKVAEVLPDPTDASRVLIRGLSSGEAHIELTDSAGTKEKYTVRVR